MSALTIYEDRVQTYRRMKVLDAKLDNSPTPNDVKEMAELRIQNLLSFKELQSLNDTGRFVNEHPLLRNKLEYEILIALWRTDKEEFLRHYSNCKNSIRRYEAKAKKTVSDEDKITLSQHRQRHEERALIFKKIITNESDN